MIKNYIKCFLLFFSFTSLLFAQNQSQNSDFSSIINQYLEDNKTRLNLLDKDIEQFIITDQYYSESTDLTNIYLNQTYEGVSIFNAISSIAVKKGEVFYYANRFISDIDSKVNTTTPVISPTNAIIKASQDFQLGAPQNLQLLSQDENTLLFSDGGISKRDIPVKLVLTQIDDELRLSWNVTVYKNDGLNWYNVRVDAVTNEVIDFNDYIINCSFDKPHNHENDQVHTLKNHRNEEFDASLFLVDGSNYNVFAFPAESPNHGSRQLVSEPASTVASPFGWHDDNGVAGAEYTITRGNNVIAQEDRDGNNGVGYSPDGTAALNFDFPLDLNQPHPGYEDVSITNLFYANNMMHDIWYHHGFDEDSGNFQANNYGNPGLGNDFVFADAQDGSGTNNATFGTPPDGQNPVMTMFMWNPPGPANDQLTINNGSQAGSYNGVEATFGTPLSPTPITANLILTVDDDIPDLNDACDNLINQAQINGNIAILRRGNCEFGVKVLAAENAGAIAAIVVNNAAGPPIAMGPGAVGTQVTIPSIMLSQADGNALIAALNNGENISATLVNNGPFLVDGDFDNGIVAHEYGHGISNRLAGGRSNTSCLFNPEQMGEGWSDWFGLMVTMRDTDTEADARGIGTFAISQPTTGQGIRPRRYSPDFAINELTYAVTNNAAAISQPHGIGSVWSTVLWDLTWAYIDKYGFDSDLFNGNGGNNRVMKLVLDGLKLQPCSPGFVDGRDSLLAADMATTGGADQCMIWEVFARRGLGFNASQGSAQSRSDQVENFDMPPVNDPTLANCSSLSVNEFSRDTVKIYPNPAQSELFITTTQAIGKATMRLTDINGRIVLERQSNSFTNNESINISSLQNGIYILTIEGESFSINEKIVKN